MLPGETPNSLMQGSVDAESWHRDAQCAYKLIEIQERFKLLKAGQRVLDLGCAPGSWLQVVEPRIGSRGRLVGIDLSRTSVAPAPQVRTIEGDAFKQAPADLIE